MIDFTLVCYDEGVWDTRAPSGPPGNNGRSGTSKEIINKDSSYSSFTFLSPRLLFGEKLRGYLSGTNIVRLFAPMGQLLIIIHQTFLLPLDWSGHIT